MKVSFKLKRFATLALPATCWALAATTTACGDDDDGTDGPVAGSSGAAGEGGSSGSSGSGGKGGSGGTGNGGSSVEGGEGGTTSDGGTGMGGEGAAPPAEGGAGGEGAAGGEGPGPVTFHPAKVNGPDGTLVPQVNDLRGLTYASSGKLWAAGYVGQITTFPGGVDRQLAIVRFNADGTLDTTFDGDGIKTVNLRERQGVDENITNDGDEYAMGIVELANGNVVILANRRDASGKGRDAVLLKMNPAGVFQNWTGLGTIRTVDFGWTEAESASFPGAPGAQPTDEGGGLALSPERKISVGAEMKTYPESLVVFGHGPAKLGEMTEEDVQRTDNDRYVVRIVAASGALDTTFNAGKPFTFNTTGVLGDNSRRGNVEADGSIISAGYTNFGSDVGNHIVVARLSLDGVPDATFAGGTPALPGVFVANPFLQVGKGAAECYNAVRQSGGRYVTTGYGRVTGAVMPPPPIPFGYDRTDAVDAVHFGFVQSPEGGILDTTFGREGTLAIQSEGFNLGGTEDRGRDLVALSDDRLVVAGRFGVAPALFVLTKDGELDDTEGGLEAGPGGTDTEPGVYLYAPLSGTTSHFFAIAKSPDGKRVAATTNGHADGALLAILDLE